MSRYKGASLALVLLGSLLLVPQASAAGGTTYKVQFGGGVKKGFTTRTLAPMHNGAPTIKIHKKDTIDFQGQPVYILPKGIKPLTWKKNYATKPGAPFSPIDRDRDKDLPGKGNNAPYKLGPGFIQEPANCGENLAGRCVFDGSGNAVTGVLAGGDRSGSHHLFVRFDANLGSTMWALGTNGPTLKSTLRIKVVANGTQATTQGQIDNAKDKFLTKERARAVALDARMRAKHTRHKMANGRYRYDAYAGADTDTIALISFYPHKIVMEKGDKVRWHFSQLKNDLHGVGLPFKKGVAISRNGVVPVCDPGAGNDYRPTGPDCGSDSFELDLLRKLLDVNGDGKFPGGRKSFETSGIRGAGVPTGKGIAGGFRPYNLKFNKSSSDKGYRYVCTIHGSFMDGRVVVNP